MPRKKDALIVVLVLAAAVLLVGLSKLLPSTKLEDRVAQQTLAPDAIEYLEETPAPQETTLGGQTPMPEDTVQPAAPAEQKPEATQKAAPVAGPMPAPQTEEVRGYVVITVRGRQYGEPIPMDRDKVITVRQEDGKTNKVHITPEKVYMESSTCENQDCVGQGEITLENYNTRILSTFVICLPNEVTIELVPVEETPKQEG